MPLTMSADQRPTKRSKIDTNETLRRLVAANESFIVIGNNLPVSFTMDNLHAKKLEAVDGLLSEYEKKVQILTKEAWHFLLDLDSEIDDKDTVKGVIEAKSNALRGEYEFVNMMCLYQSRS